VHSVKCVQIFDAITCLLTPPGRLEAHSNIIYDLSWSADSHVLVSCSSDCTSKVWYLDAATSFAQCSHVPFTAPRVASVPYCTVLYHPSFVYSCKLHPNASLEQLATAHRDSHPCAGAVSDSALLLVTGCADGMLHFWSLNADIDPHLPPDGAEPLLRKRAGNTLRADGSVACLNALLWDVHADTSAHQFTSSCIVEPGGVEGNLAVTATSRDGSARVAGTAGRATSSRSGNRNASSALTEQQQQHSSLLFSGALSQILIAVIYSCYILTVSCTTTFSGQSRERIRAR
jgi:WD40 repeat protein